MDISVDEGENWFPITVMGALSLHGELVFPYVVPDTLAAATPAGIARVAAYSERCLVRVQRYDNNEREYEDVSDDTFTIAP
ncbi:MAG: hypothetical protein GF331_11340 [Chitinivibrionales bacterium]|nr:hypothetical protein [Chitinivibrionales bacterium]